MYIGTSRTLGLPQIMYFFLLHSSIRCFSASCHSAVPIMPESAVRSYNYDRELGAIVAPARVCEWIGRVTDCDSR